MSSFNSVDLARKRFFFVKLLGMYPITIVDGKSVFKLRDLLPLAVKLTFTSSLFYFCIKNRDQLKISELEIVDQRNFVSYIAALIVDIVTPIYCCIFRHEAWKIIVFLKEIDEKFGKLQKDFTKIAIFFFKFYLIVASLALPVSLVICFMDGLLMKAFLHLYVGFDCILIIGVLVNLVLSVLIRIKTINDNLENILLQAKDKKSLQFEHKVIEVIANFIEIYGKLINVNRLTNLCFGVPVMLFFGVLFFFTIFALFATFKVWSTDGVLDTVALGSVLFSAYMYLFLTTMIFMFHLAKNEAEQTIKLVNTMLNKTKNEISTQMLIAFGSLVHRNKPKFTCELFDFDWKLISAVSFKNF